METYKRNVQIIEDAFEQIKEATGISSTEEIVTTFIKAEEQNISLWNYVYVLNSEIDMIDEQNKQIEAEIKMHEEIQTMSTSDKERVREQLVKRSEEMKVQIQEKEAQISFMEHQMADITKYVQNMVGLFNRTQFYNLTSVANHQDYDGTVVFNENNVTTYMSELEEYLNQMIILINWNRKESNYLYSALDTDNMKIKEKDASYNPIDAP